MRKRPGTPRRVLGAAVVAIAAVRLVLGGGPAGPDRGRRVRLKPVT